MAKRKRNIVIRFRVTPEEREMIESMAAYLRKISIDGYVVRLDLPELREMVSLLRRSSNNLNQIAKRVNETSRIYDADIDCLKENQEKIWSAANGILTRLASIK